MIEDGRSPVRRWVLLESVYKGGRRFVVTLAKHPFETVLQSRLVQFAQDTGDEMTVLIDERGGGNRRMSPIQSNNYASPIRPYCKVLL